MMNRPFGQRSVKVQERDGGRPCETEQELVHRIERNAERRLADASGSESVANASDCSGGSTEVFQPAWHADRNAPLHVGHRKESHLTC